MTASAYPGSDTILERMMALHPKIIDLTLDRVFRLLDALGNPHRDLPPVIHIAGTNGKGSTQAMIRAGLCADGKRVQTYTSPHLARFHERIRLSDGLIAEPALAAVLAECEAANGSAAITYFEITTVAALLAFARDPADYCILEVGLGGRLDATNVIDRPALSVITPISIDHQQFLGDTLEEIAGEKAGILKPGIPAIIAGQGAAAADVIDARATAIGAGPLLSRGQDWDIWEEHGRVAFQDQDGLMDLPRPALIGAHQVENAGTALAALRLLGASDAAQTAALTDARWPARMQHLGSGPLIDLAGAAELWLDGGHNPAAGTALAEALGRLDQRPLYAICGMLNTKDVTGFMRPFAPRIRRLYGVSIPDAAATLTAEETTAAARDAGIEAVEAASVAVAIRAITAECKNARILICGSLYLAGDVLKENA